MFVGDVNGHHQDWLGSTTTNRHGVAAFDFATIFGCDQLVVGPTHARCGTLDLLITVVPDLVRVAVVAPIGNSDHSLLLSAVISMVLAVPNLCVSRKVFLKHEVKWNTVYGAIKDLPWRNIWLADNSVEVLNEHLSLLVGRYVRAEVIRVRNKDKPLFDDQNRGTFGLKEDAHLRWTRGSCGTCHMASSFLPLSRTTTTAICSSSSLLVISLTSAATSMTGEKEFQTWRACSCVTLLVSIKRTAALSLASQLRHQDRACQMHLWLSLASQLHLQDRACQMYLWLSLTSQLHRQDRAWQMHLWLSLASQLHLQDRACKCTFDFHSQVTSSLRRAIQVHIWLSLASHLTSQDVFTYTPFTLSQKLPRTCYPSAHPRTCYPSARVSSSHKSATADFVQLGTGLPLRHGSLFVVQWSCSCELDTALSVQKN